MAAETSNTNTLSELPKPAALSAQPKPFTIDHILSHSSYHVEQADARHCIFDGSYEDVNLLKHQGFDRISERYATDHETQLSSGLSFRKGSSSSHNRSSVARELDMLRKNLVQANLSNFTNQPHVTRSNFESLDVLDTIPSYRKTKEPNRELTHRQQDEALDMSKNKFLGKLLIYTSITYLLHKSFHRRKFLKVNSSCLYR